LNQKLPQHVAIVMDGNGRWAENRGLDRVEGHRAGVDAVRAVIQSCMQKKIAVLSLFAFSSENWARPPTEVDFLMALFLKALTREIDEMHQQGIRVCFSGDRTPLSSVLRAEMDAAEIKTAANQALIVNFAINYGGQWDILKATKTLALKVAKGEIDLESIDHSAFSQALDTHGLPDPDLFIRTSGEQRISNFYLWQLAYTELYFSEVYWPDFSVSEFETILDWFSKRQRRFGQLTYV
jgi:undecaprenyl diphosphate synthase